MYSKDFSSAFKGMPRFSMRVQPAWHEETPNGASSTFSLLQCFVHHLTKPGGALAVPVANKADRKVYSGLCHSV